jgi:hypothetical protein
MLQPAPRLALLLLCLSPLAGPAYAKAGRPVVVELFTSQGCGACTKANALIADLAQRRDVLALTFPVDYWDYLGWQDTFAKPEFSTRQRAYMKAAGEREVFTPQVVVDGAPQADRSAVDKAPDLIKAALKAAPPEPDMRLAHDRVAVGSGPAPEGGADVWLVRYDPRIVQVPIKRGENGGRTLPHRNVVRELVRIGRWDGQAIVLAAPPAKDPALALAVLVQQSGGGPILAAARA